MNIRNLIAENKLADFGKVEPSQKDFDEDVKPIESFDEPLVHPPANNEFDSEEEYSEPQVSKPRLNKKKLILILLFWAVIGGAAYFILPMLKKEDEPISKIPEVLPAPSFIDAAEPENKALKDNPEAKKNHVNVFEFDINNCLQTYTEAECIDMFDKNLQINE